VPELPEVETIARDLRPGLTGAHLTTVRVHRPDVLRDTTPAALARALCGRRVAEVGRRAKHLVLLLDDGARLVIHPRMTGSLYITAKRERDPYGVLDVGLGAGGRLVFRDVRRLGTVQLLRPDLWATYSARIGPEPLEKAFNAAALGRALLGGKLAVKKALMDQRRLAGVGNIYANEALWIGRIDPSRPARGLTQAEIVRLHRAGVGVLRRAVAGRGTTVRDYRTGTGGPGTFQGRLAVYGRAGEPCLACGHRLALTHAIDARATYFCPWCQS
jgi:formamidopyrimidine-DNA glycosylase